MSSQIPDIIPLEFSIKVAAETRVVETKETVIEPCVIRRYRHSNKPRKKAGPRTWRTRKDPFQESWSKLRLQLEINPVRTAKNLLDNLMSEQPGQFNINLLRTLQRRVANWRLEQMKIKQENNRQVIVTQHDMIGAYVSLTGHAVTNR